MKTTVELPDQLYRRIKARAALRGQTVKAFFLDALRDKLAQEGAPSKGEVGWRAAFGAARREDVEKVQQIIDEEFSTIDPEGWQ